MRNGEPQAAYSTSFVLPPGRYELKFVVRENEPGKMGSFFTELNIPDLKKYSFKLRSIVLTSQRIHRMKEERLLSFPSPEKAKPIDSVYTGIFLTYP